MRRLVAVEAEPESLLIALREALTGDGPAVLPLELGVAAPTDLPAEVPKRVAVVIETSGSAGRRKRVALSADALLAGAGMTEGALGGPGRWLLALPAHYIAGLQVLVRSIMSDTAPVLLEPGFAPTDFVAAMGLFGRERRYTSLVPAQLVRLLDAADGDADVAAALRGVDVALIGGQRTPAAVADRAQARGLHMVRTYGSSETAGGCVYDGVPLGGTHVRIDDGEVLISSPTLAEGYLDDPERTAAAFISAAGERWYRTGDAGATTDEGVLTVTGRRDDVLISGGEKVSLSLVEQVVRELPHLDQAVVVRAPDDRWGEVPVVVSEHHADLAAVRAAVADRLGRAAAPARIVQVDALPLLPSGKPDRLALTDLAARPVVHVSAVLVTDETGRVLLVRKRGTSVFMQPGGKPEPGETGAETAVRELSEELAMSVEVGALTPLGEFRAAAANEDGFDVVADTFAIEVPTQSVHPRAEIEEIVWIDPARPGDLKLAPLTTVHLLPLIAAKRAADTPPAP